MNSYMWVAIENICMVLISFAAILFLPAYLKFFFIIPLLNTNLIREIQSESKSNKIRGPNNHPSQQL
jgi:hypothetical protein